MIKNTTASSVTVNKPVSGSQILVKICRNDAQWLSPTGWAKDSRSTLLDCRSDGKTTEIYLPKAFASKIATGDKIHLESVELDVNHAFNWQRVAQKVEKKKKSGLMSRFRRDSNDEAQLDRPIAQIPSGPEGDMLSAEKAADIYKEKMRAAQIAQEAAQKAAAEAARQAELAQNAQAERALEMERISRALEEAERQKEAERIRLEEIRKAEEARRIEEARLAEEARLREEARLLAEFKAEANRKLAGEVSEKRNALGELKTTLKSEVERIGELKTAEQILSETIGTLETLKSEAEVNKQKQAAKVSSELEKIDQTKTKLSSARTAAKPAEDQKAKMLLAVKAAADEHRRAAERAAAAKREAEERQRALELAQEQEAAALKAFNEHSEKISQIDAVLANQTLQYKSVNAELEAASSYLEEKTTDFTVNVGNLKQTKSKLELAEYRTQQLKDEISFNKRYVAARQQTKKSILEAQNIGEVEILLSRVDDLVNKTTVKEAEAHEAMLEAEEESGIFTRVSQLFTRSSKDDIVIKDENVQNASSKRAALNNPANVKTKIIDAEVSAAQAAKKTSEATQSAKKNSENAIKQALTPDTNKMPKTLMSGLAIIGLAGVIGLAFNENNDNSLNTANASAATEFTSAPFKQDVAALDIATPKVESAKIEKAAEKAIAAAPKIDVAKIEVPKIDLKAEVKAPVTAPVEAAPKIEARPKVETKIEAPKAVAKVEKPKVAAKPKVRKVASLNSAPKIDQKAIAERRAKITRIQTQLKELGFMNGEANGLQTAETSQAIRDYKSLYDLGSSTRITTRMQAHLVNAIEDRARLAEIEANQPVYVASVTTAPASAELSAPVTYGISDSYIAPATAPAVEQVASLSYAPAALPTPSVVQEAKLISQDPLVYPTKPLRRGFQRNVEVQVTYDVLETGEIGNAIVTEINYNGAYKSHFEKAAMASIRSRKFSPKTIDGQAVAHRGVSTLLKFQIN